MMLDNPFISYYSVIMTKKQTRQHFRAEVFRRDRYECVKCGCIDELNAHHITDRNEMTNGGYVKENGVSLCRDCHWKAEQFHWTGTSAEGYSPEDLYNLIGSSYEKACSRDAE